MKYEIRTKTLWILGLPAGGMKLLEEGSMNNPVTDEHLVTGGTLEKGWYLPISFLFHN